MDDETASNDSGLHLPPDDQWSEWVPEEVISVPTQPAAASYDGWEPAGASYAVPPQGEWGSSQPSAEGFICERHESSDDEDMELNPDIEEGSDFFAQRISCEEYNKQKKQYTQEAVNKLMHSPEYQRFVSRCQMCWCVWSEEQCSAHCEECGGYAMTRPCPVCRGKCTSVWRRDVELSHSQHFAHWDGQCLLPEDERRGFMAQVLMDNPSPENSENAMLEALEDLATS